MCKVNEYGDPLLSYNYNCCKICTGSFLCIKDATFGKWISRSCKQGANLPPKLKGDLHKHDHVNFSCCWIDTISTSIIVGTRDGYFSQCWNPLHEIPIIVQNGGEVVKVLVHMLCGVLNVVYAPIQVLSFNVMFCIKDTNHECKAKILSSKTTIGVHAPCYSGWWNNFRGGFWESHKIWFCHDYLHRYVGRNMCW